MRLRKYIVFFTAALFSCTAISGQGLINSGAAINIGTGAYIYIDGGFGVGNFLNQDAGAFTGSSDNGGTIDVTGNWTNNSTANVFTTNNGTVRLIGANQDISGTTATWFNNLTLGGSGNKTLFVNALTGGGFAAPSGKLDLGNRPLILNSNTLIINNPNPGLATIDNSAGGYIVSETNAAANPSILQWNIGVTNGTYIYPFGDASAVLIPFTLDKTAGTATVSVSTRESNIAARDNQPWQTGVTNMYSTTIGGPGEIPVVVDRWWDINPTANITAGLTFTYIGAENTLNAAYQAGPFGAQTWNGAGWNPPVGTGPGVTAGTAQVVVPPAVVNTRPWVLSSIAAPLPVEMLTITVACENKNAIIKWSTASENNNSYFTIEKSSDGNQFNEIGRVKGNGTTHIIHSYSYTDLVPKSEPCYYRIRQTDFNASSAVTNAVSFKGCADLSPFSIFFSSAENSFYINATITENCTIIIYDVTGRKVSDFNTSIKTGLNKIDLADSNLAGGIYFVTFSGAIHHDSRKIAVLK